MESKIWVKGHHCESAVGMAVSPPCSERLGHPAFHASCGPLSRPHSPLHHQVSGKLPRLPQLHICWVQSPRGRPSILYGYKDGPRHGQDGVAVIWNTRTALGIIVSVFCLYKERLIFTLRMLPEVTGTSVAARIHKRPGLLLDMRVHTEVSHLPGPPTPGAIREFEKKMHYFFFVSFGISLMQDCLLYLESTFGKRKKTNIMKLK